MTKQNEIKNAAIPKQNKTVQEIMAQTGNAAELKVPTAEEWALYLKTKAENEAKLLELAGEVAKLKESKSRAKGGFRPGSTNAKAEELLRELGDKEYDGTEKPNITMTEIVRELVVRDFNLHKEDKQFEVLPQTACHQIRNHFKLKGWIDPKAEKIEE